MGGLPKARLGWPRLDWAVTHLASICNIRSRDVSLRSHVCNIVRRARLPGHLGAGAWPSGDQPALGCQIRPEIVYAARIRTKKNPGVSGVRSGLKGKDYSFFFFFSPPLPPLPLAAASSLAKTSAREASALRTAALTASRTALPASFFSSSVLASLALA